MSDTPNNLQPRKITGINRIGLYTLIHKEIARFLNVYVQTLASPVITTLLFYTVFALAFGGLSRDIGGVPFMEFLAPGLIMMAMVQNAFANSSSSLVIAKVQGNIVDVLMPPLSTGELFTGYAVGALVRGILVGLVTAAVMILFVKIHYHSFALIVVFSILGNMMLGSLGIAAGIWSDKFDHMASVTNFIITPLAFLSGTFYSIEQLPGIWRTLAFYNPFFYMIDGFRAGFIGHADGSIVTGIIVLVAINAALAALCMRMISSGYKIKS